MTRLAQQDDALIYAIGLLTEEDRREAKKAQRALQSSRRVPAVRCFIPKEVSEVDPHRARGGARYPQPVHDRLYAIQRGARWDVPADQGGSQGSGQPGGAHQERLLRIKGPTKTPKKPSDEFRARTRAAGTPDLRNPDRVETAEGVQAPALAQPVPEMADRNVVGNRSRRHYTRNLLSVLLAAPRRPDALFQWAGANSQSASGNGSRSW